MGVEHGGARQVQLLAVVTLPSIIRVEDKPLMAAFGPSSHLGCVQTAHVTAIPLGSARFDHQVERSATFGTSGGRNLCLTHRRPREFGLLVL